jgi:microcystin-dependent protein
MSYVGEIRLFAGSFAPAGWSFCDGGLLPISENETLFVLIGTTYGGDGESTFGLPDLRGRVPIHHGTNPQTGITFTPGEIAGVESVTLTTNQIPQHTHALNGAGTDGNQQSPAGRLPATSPTIKPYRNAQPTAAMKPFAGPDGGSQPHDNLQPYLGVNFIIAQFGEFPQQS